MTELIAEKTQFVRAATVAEVRERRCMAVQLNGHTVALFADGEAIHAVDNRCPHMGFPLDRGSVRDGILTCHWHHARFDLASGGTFDQWADDVRRFPVEIRGDEVWVDLTRYGDRLAHQQGRLRVGLERDISLVIGKAVLVLLEEGGDPVAPFRIGLEFGARYRQNGWGQGLTMLSCFMNLLPHLDPEDRPRALYHGLAAVARDSAGSPPRFPVEPLPSAPGEGTDRADIPTLKRWFRRFVEVRDSEGAERCIISAIRAGADDRQMADMLFSAVTDHRYIQVGHVADFTNKAFEALDIAGWEYAEPVLTSLVPAYAMADRMEESNAWRNPIDLVAILEDAFDRLPSIVDHQPGLVAESRSNGQAGQWAGREALIPVLLGDDPAAIVAAMEAALREGCTAEQLAATVVYAAALRIARFHTSNEFGDWDTALHTFTFANAIHQGIRRAPSVELLRGVFDAAMSVYLDRFLNVPAARLPEGTGNGRVDLAQLPALLDRQQQVNESGQLVGHYLADDGEPEPLLAMLGKLLLREDRDFHTIQAVEGAVAQYQLLRGSDAGNHVLVAAGRYLAAHAPTMRAQGQTYQIAYRLHRGDRLFEGDQGLT